MNAQSVLMDKSGFMIHSHQPSHRQDDTVRQLAKMTPDELAERWENIDAQSQVYSWFLCYYIRQKLKSKSAFGKFIDNLRVSNPYHPLCVIGQQQRTRYIQAASFLLKRKITDPSKIGISPTALYMLARPINEPVADKVFSEARGKNQPVYIVEKLIRSAREDAGLSNEPETLRMKAEVRELRQVEPIKAREPIKEWPAQPEIKEVEEIDEIEANLRVMDAQLEMLKRDITLDNETRRRRDLVRELGDMDASLLTREQQKDELKLLVKSYGLSFMAEAGLLQECAKEIAARGYGK